MKKVTLSVLFFFWTFCICLAEGSPFLSDTVVINYGNRGQVLITAADAETLEAITKLDFNALMDAIAVYADSARGQEDRKLEVNDDYLGQFRVEVSEAGGEKIKIAYTPQEPLTSKEIEECDTGFRCETNIPDSVFCDAKGVVSVYLGLDLGLNTYLENGQIPGKETDYELRPWGSRYISIGVMARLRLGKSVYFRYGLSVSWYNFMFEGNRRILLNNRRAYFGKENFDMKKSKLTVCHLNLPLMFQFGRKSTLFRVGFGGYAGYRLDSYSKIKFEKNRQKNHNNFGLNTFRYGLSAELGLRRLDGRLFINYDLSTLFAHNSQLPKLNPLSFGLRF